MAREPKQGSLVTIRGEGPIVWRVKHVGVALGLHHLVATLETPSGSERWVRDHAPVSLDRLDLVPVDLEDFPCTPV